MLLPRDVDLVDLASIINLDEALHVLDSTLVGAERLDDLHVDLLFGLTLLGLVTERLGLCHFGLE